MLETLLVKGNLSWVWREAFVFFSLSCFVKCLSLNTFHVLLVDCFDIFIEYFVKNIIMILVFSKALQSVLGMYMIVIIIIIIIMILIMIMIIIINFVIIIVIVIIIIIIIVIIIIIIICVQVFASSVELKQRENPSAWNTALWQVVS